MLLNYIRSVLKLLRNPQLLISLIPHLLHFQLILGRPFRFCLLNYLLNVGLYVVGDRVIFLDYIRARVGVYYYLLSFKLFCLSNNCCLCT